MSTRAKRTPPASVNRLSIADQFGLMNYTRECYAASKQTDREFAKAAESFLGFPVTVGNIQGCRDALGLQNNRDILREEKKAPKNRLEAIEQRLEKLEALARQRT